MMAVCQPDPLSAKPVPTYTCDDVEELEARKDSSRIEIVSRETVRDKSQDGCQDRHEGLRANASALQFSGLVTARVP